MFRKMLQVWHEADQNGILLYLVQIGSTLVNVNSSEFYFDYSKSQKDHSTPAG